MNLEKKISTLLTVCYVVSSLLVLLYVNQNLLYEFVFKVSSLVCLSFLYLIKSNRIHFWYLMVLLFSIVSDSLLVYGNDLILQGAIFLLLSRIAYIIIVKNTVYKHSLKIILKYSIPFLITFLIFFSLVYSKLGNLFYISLGFGFLSIVIGLLSFLDYLDKNTTKSFYFFLGIFMLIIGDVLMTISNFIEEKQTYIIVYHILYYVALYIICSSMIVKKVNRLA